jgi:hypothetical protein
MINEVAGKMFEQFTLNLRRELERERSGTTTSPESGEPQPVKALPIVASAIGEGIARSVKQIFGGHKES